MKTDRSISFAKGFTLLEVVITMVLTTVIILSMGTILAHTQKATNKQMIIEHVNNYGHSALKFISEEIRRAEEIHISSILGMSRLNLTFPDGSQPKSITISANPENGMMSERDPLLTIRNKKNAFLFEDNNSLISVTPNRWHNTPLSFIKSFDDLMNLLDMLELYGLTDEI
mgnify:CR=1 FL=1